MSDSVSWDLQMPFLRGYMAIKKGLSQISSFAILIFGLKPKCNIASVLLRYKNHFVALTLVSDSHFLIEIGGDRMSDFKSQQTQILRL